MYNISHVTKFVFGKYLFNEIAGIIKNMIKVNNTQLEDDTVLITYNVQNLLRLIGHVNTVGNDYNWCMILQRPNMFISKS